MEMDVQIDHGMGELTSEDEMPWGGLKHPFGKNHRDQHV